MRMRLMKSSKRWPNPDQKARLSDSYQQKKKERTCRKVNFAVPADHCVKIKECKRETNA